MCNIGTTFKTGINIEKSNTSFFIIAPPKYAYEDKDFKVFAGGISSVIQALARVRGNGNTHIFFITPPPGILIKNPARVGSYFQYLKKIPVLIALALNEKTTNFKSLDKQGNVVDNYY
jgi:hypothetical protein